MSSLEEESLGGLAVLRELSYRNGNMDKMLEYTILLYLKILKEDAAVFFEQNEPWLEALQWSNSVKIAAMDLEIHRWLCNFPKLTPEFHKELLHVSLVEMYRGCLKEGIRYSDYWKDDKYKIDITATYAEGVGWEFTLRCDDMHLLHPLRAVTFPQVVLPEKCECSVCLDDVKEGGTQCNCGNYFHIPCLKAQIEDSRCPLCREDMVKIFAQKNDT